MAQDPTLCLGQQECDGDVTPATQNRVNSSNGTDTDVVVGMCRTLDVTDDS